MAPVPVSGNRGHPVLWWRCHLIKRYFIERYFIERP